MYSSNGAQKVRSMSSSNSLIILMVMRVRSVIPQGEYNIGNSSNV